ncbi:dienelactone hydrolase family protein [Burkholderia pyrrocinia]|uniref:dienelactone hydrolase family protein n=1 Tax=Burkholderia pyrrocinia TaxID=60550 RepID=UPI0015755DB7|nr:dienelactone hydrolase family protein [Burkholderia pyrrocinia]NTX26970.1 dienelactone hydrolase family protein [Burkholderia pyrrocinia]QVN20339.1 dienelactone hydrolase family protein [Burkholderia pyrrocinia]
MPPSISAIDTFDIEVDGIVHDVRRHDDARLEETRARILMFPDFEGTASPGAARLAAAYSRACGAEVLLTDFYGKSYKPDGYDHRADSVIRYARARPLETRRRLTGILAALVPHWHARGPLVTIGFCFGGSLAFELARADRTVTAAVSIHGDPSTEASVSAGATDAEFTMIHGGSDPLIPSESISSFTQEVTAAQLRWQLIVLGHARHSFTKREMGGSNWAMRYDARADEMARAHAAAIVDLHVREAR